MDNNDQASRLRQLFQEQKATSQRTGSGARVIAVSGGKGGVGKTNVTANLAIAFASQGKRVVVFDADYALANIDILLGFSPRFTIEHVLDGSMGIGDILISGPGGIKVVPAASGVQHLAGLDGKQLNHLLNALQVLEKYFDILLIDTAAGIGDSVISMLTAAREVLVVTNPEPPAFVDSYALIKHLLSVSNGIRMRLIINQVRNESEARSVYDKINKTVAKFLKQSVEYLGFITEDIHVKNAVRKRKAFLLQYPNADASKCISWMAYKLANEKLPERKAGFWNDLQLTLASSNR